LLVLYTLFIYLALPFIFLRLLWKSRAMPAYRERIPERFGCFKAPDFTTDIWLHAVSLGESIAAEPLIKKLLERYPEKRIVVTNMTPTGTQRVRSTFGDRVLNLYVPYDYPDALKRFINRLQPKLLILMETELWPNLLDQCQRHHIKVLIANARLSELSAKHYQWIAPVVATMLAKVNVVAAQSQADADRFQVLGMPSSGLQTVGNIKFDISVDEAVLTKGHDFRERLGRDRPVWIAASTHGGEEEIVLQAHAQIRKTCPDALLLLVPRHPERFDAVTILSQQAGFTTVRRTDAGQWPADVSVVIGDSIGEMMMYYASTDIAFVAGSLAPIGGHNILEPAALKMPILSGTYMMNFLEIERLLKEKHGLTTVKNAQELAEQVITLIQHPDQRLEQGKKAYAAVAENRGSLARHLDLINNLLGGV